MQCPVCKNKVGFNCGTCIDCGYNYLNHEFTFINVSVNDLRNILSPDILECLIHQHYVENKLI